MRTDELRSVLHQHAEETIDRGIPDRVSAVHERVTAVRRGRRTGLAGVAVVAVAAAALSVVPGLVGTERPGPADHPAPPRLAGFEISATERVGLITYRYAQSVTSKAGARNVQLALGSSDKVRALTWADSGATGGKSVLRVDGKTWDRQEGGGLTAGLLLSPGREHRVTLTRRGPQPDGKIGLAVYQQTGKPPAGVTDGMVTFRRTVAADHLLAAVIGKPGEPSVAFDVKVPSLRLRLSSSCYGTSPQWVPYVRINGHPTGGIYCQQSADPDPGPSGMVFSATDPNVREWGIKPGDTVHVTVDLRRAHDTDGALVHDPTAVFGVGLYELGPSAGTVAGQDVLRFTESGNGPRIEEYVRSVESRPGDRQLTLRLEAADTQRWVTAEMTPLEGGTVRMFVDGRPSSEFGPRSMTGGEVGIAPGRPHIVRLVHTGGGSPRGVLGLVVRAPAH